MSDGPRPISPAQGAIIGLAVASSGGAFFYRILIQKQLGHSAAMFLGLPLMFTILIALTLKTRTLTGGIVKGITLALLIVAPILGEGFLCILMASPLFYLVGIVVGLIVDFAKRDRKTTASCVALVLFPMCLEGVIPGWSFNRSQSLAVSRTVNASSVEVERALELSPRIGVPLPELLRIGFPRPMWAYGQGLTLGASRTIHFSGAEGDPPGDLVMRVTGRRAGYVRFETLSDGSKLTQWLKWDASEVTWRPIDATHTEVTWRLLFERELDPAWYFAPLERAAVRLAAEFLIEANATPGQRN